MSTLAAPPSSRFGFKSRAGEVIAGIDLSGRTAIVTGAASGIGIETARALATAGATVVLPVRRPEAGQKVAEQINRKLPQPRVRVETMDLASLASVRAFAGRWGERPLHLLINNAGVMALPLQRTVDGFEMQLGVNHLGHFELTRLLTPALRLGAPSRVVAVSSASHLDGDFRYDDPDWRRDPYERFEAYSSSKTAGVLFAVAYSQRYGDEGVFANAVHPGAIITPLGRHVGLWTAIRKGWLGFGKNMPKFKSPAQGAATSVWVATAPELEGVGGRYFEDCREARPWSAEVKFAGVKPYALDRERAERLWQISEQLIDGAKA